MVARRLLVSGKVQGVFYRGWTEATARSLGLTGWVRNLRSGDVEIHAEGPEEAIEELIRRCWDGPSAARVTGVRTEEAPSETLQLFRTRATR